MTTVLAHHLDRLAHRSHQCGDCRGRIARGDRYSDQRLAYDDRAYTYREHALCRALFEMAWARREVEEDDLYDATDSDLPDWWRAFVATFAPGALA